MNNGSLTASVGLRVSGTKAPQGTATTSTLPSPDAGASAGVEARWTYGTGSGQVDLIVAQDRTLNATTAETLNLYDGTVKDLFGDAAAFRKLKFLGVWVVTGGDSAGVAVGGAASNATAAFFADATDKVKVFPSGPGFQTGSPAGVTVGATTCNLKVENLGAVAVTYRLVLGGTSA